HRWRRCRRRRRLLPSRCIAFSVPGTGAGRHNAAGHHTDRTHKRHTNGHESVIEVEEMNCTFLRTQWSRLIAWALIAAQVLILIPLDALAGSQAQAKKPEEKIAVNRRPPVVTPLAAFPQFSASPTDEELFRARVF